MAELSFDSFVSSLQKGRNIHGEVFDVKRFDELSRKPFMLLHQEVLAGDVRVIVNPETNRIQRWPLSFKLNYIVQNILEEMELHEAYRVQPNGETVLTEQPYGCWYTGRETGRTGEDPLTIALRALRSELDYDPDPAELTLLPFRNLALPLVRPSSAYCIETVEIVQWVSVSTRTFSCAQPIVFEDEGTRIHIEPHPLYRITQGPVAMTDAWRL